MVSAHQPDARSHLGLIAGLASLGAHGLVLFLVLSLPPAPLNQWVEPDGHIVLRRARVTAGKARRLFRWGPPPPPVERPCGLDPTDHALGLLETRGSSCAHIFGGAHCREEVVGCGLIGHRVDAHLVHLDLHEPDAYVSPATLLSFPATTVRGTQPTPPGDVRPSRCSPSGLSPGNQTN